MRDRHLKLMARRGPRGDPDAVRRRTRPGLGQLTVQSGLGQPLNAEIELLSVKRGETITARLAPPEVYQQANAQLNPALVGTRITVEKRANGELYLRVSTPRPIQEPFIELIVELNSESGRVMRQYTALLDPPGYGRGAAKSRRQPSAGGTACGGARDAARTGTRACERVPLRWRLQKKLPPGRLPRPRARAAPAAGCRPGRIRSDQAGRNAAGNRAHRETRRRHRRADARRAAPAQSRRVHPKEHESREVGEDPQSARSERDLGAAAAGSRARSAAPGRTISTRTGTSSPNGPRAASEEGSATRGRIGTVVTDSAAPGRATPCVSRAASRRGKAAAGEGHRAEDRIRILEEEAIARQRALAEASDRIGQLEKIIKDMQRLAELRTPGAPAAQKGPEPPSPSHRRAKAPASVSGTIAPPRVEQSAPRRPSVEAPRLPSESPSASQASPDTSAGSAGGCVGGAGRRAASEGAAPKAAPVPAPESSGSFLDDLLAEPMYLLARRCGPAAGFPRADLSAPSQGGPCHLRHATTTRSRRHLRQARPSWGGGTRTSPAAAAAGAPSPQVADTRVTQRRRVVRRSRHRRLVRARPRRTTISISISRLDARRRPPSPPQRAVPRETNTRALPRAAGPKARGRRPPRAALPSTRRRPRQDPLRRSRDFHAASFACRTGCRARRGFGERAGNGPDVRRNQLPPPRFPSRSPLTSQPVPRSPQRG